ncbi:MAG TPA: hypothetical protein VEX39_02065 [Thermoleophilaceae bacterium]|nr:hypothetical protein [Thermoleophilaceae bacterium]
MCVALLALFVALGGSAYAAAKISAKQIRTGAVGTRAVKNGSLAGTDIRKNSLGPGTIAEQGLDTRKFKTVPSARVAGSVVKNAIGASELGTVTRRFGRAVSVANAAAGKAEVGCDKGEIVVGGGGRWSSTAPGLQLQSSYAASDAGWTAIGGNGSGAPRQLQAFAMCLAP